MKKIKIDKELIKKEFNRLNKKYFNNKLKKIPIEINTSKKFVAYLELEGKKFKNREETIWYFSNPKRIFFSNRFTISKKILTEVLCHEMIHQLMAQNQECEYGKSPHGENFASYCYQIEQQSNLNIPRS